MNLKMLFLVFVQVCENLIIGRWSVKVEPLNEMFVFIAVLDLRGDSF